MPSAYLAGPEVFHAQRQRIFAERRSLCTALGLVAVLPIDDEAEMATEVYRLKVQMLERCDAIVAHLTPPRVWIQAEWPSSPSVWPRTS
jgi:nucleoside 2-deoxyribosyltransferase